MNKQQISNRLNDGDTILLIDTGNNIGYTDYYRFLSDGETAPIKSLLSLEKANKFSFKQVVRIPEHIATMKSSEDMYYVRESIINYMSNNI